jgi:transposase
VHRAAKARDTSPHGYTPQEVADLYGISRNTVYDWLKKRPEASTTNRPRRLSGSEIEAFEQELDQKRQRKAVHDQLGKKGLTESATFKQI